MRLANLFGHTLRESPAEAEMPSHQLALRAGLVRQMAAGIYSYLPLGWRALQAIAAIVREEMVAAGGQELLMPLAQPAELWRASGRYDAPAPGPALLRFSDRGNHEMVLAMTHEEAATDLARQEIHSYRQLPLMIFQIQLKFRDEPRARGGLVRVREFLMKDGYSFHTDEDSLGAQYDRVYAAYQRILARCELDATVVEADSGMMGGRRSHEFMVVNPAGEDTLLRCEDCGYAANAETAAFAKAPGTAGEPAPVERIATPGTTSIDALARLLGITPAKTLKAVFFAGPAGELIFAVIRGDLEVNEAKLSTLLGGIELAPAGSDLLAAAGIVPGYASPVSIGASRTAPVRVVADDSVSLGANFVAGANETGYHLRNVNYPRDFQADLVGDIALARDGDRCPHCGAALHAVRGIEVGHIFQLGTKYSEQMGATFHDAAGRECPLVMGCYGIGLGRLLACVLEQHRDERGIVWPASLAPYPVHVVVLGDADTPVGQAAADLETALCAAGLEPLFDDRSESAGVKFNDADLMGMPVRLTVSRRSLAQGGVEIKGRSEESPHLVPVDQAVAAVQAMLAAPGPE